GTVESSHAPDRPTRCVERFVLPAPSLEARVEATNGVPEGSRDDDAAGDPLAFAGGGPVLPVALVASENLLRPRLGEHVAQLVGKNKGAGLLGQLDAGDDLLGVE